MHLGMSKSKNSTSLYVLKSTYRNGFHSTSIVEKLGTVAELREKLNGEDPYEWARAYIAELNRQEKEGKREVTAKYSPVKLIEKNEQRTFNGGFLFLQQTYMDLGLPKMCREIRRRRGLDFDLNTILSRIICSRILYPESTDSCYDNAGLFIGKREFTRDDVTAALAVLAAESEHIQSALYANTRKMFGSDTGRLFYDSTICLHDAGSTSQESIIIPMDLYFDGNMIPVAYAINPDHLEEPPLSEHERQVRTAFSGARALTLSDGGITSSGSRTLRGWNIPNDHIITLRYSQLSDELRQAAMDEEGWKLPNRDGLFSFHDTRQVSDPESLKGCFYKDIEITNHGIRRRVIITVSLQRLQNVRYEREKLAIQSHDLQSLQNAYNENSFATDGIQAYMTNLFDMSAEEIITITSLREDTHHGFRIHTNEFSGADGNLSVTESIQAHFITCYCALVVYASMLRKLDMFSSAQDILLQMKTMNFMKIPTEGYVPLYTRTDLTDLLHDRFGFRTDYQIISRKQMGRLLKMK